MRSKLSRLSTKGNIVRGEHGGLVCHGPRWEASKPEVVYRGRELLWQPRFALTPGRSSVFRVIRKCSIIRDHCILSCTASSSRTKVPQASTYALCLYQRWAANQRENVIDTHIQLSRVVPNIPEVARWRTTESEILWRVAACYNVALRL